MIDFPLSQKKGFLFDLDGCIYHGDVVANGAKEVISHLRSLNKKVRFITNNSSDNSKMIQQKLLKMGISVYEYEIFTTTDYIGLYLKERYGLSNVKVVGSQILKDCISNHGHRILDDFSEQNSDFIIVGRDITFTYEKLKMVVNEVSNGAIPIGTNPDLTHPGENREIIPETGSLLSAVQSIVGKEIESFGKPAPYLFEYGMASINAKAIDCVMVGDNYHTDIIGAMELGISTVWLTNLKLPKQYDGIANPPIIFPDMQAFFRLCCSSYN